MLFQENIFICWKNKLIFGRLAYMRVVSHYMNRLFTLYPLCHSSYLVIMQLEDPIFFQPEKYINFHKRKGWKIMRQTSLSDKRLSRSLNTAMSTLNSKFLKVTLHSEIEMSTLNSKYLKVGLYSEIEIIIIPEGQVWVGSASSCETKKS